MNERRLLGSFAHGSWPNALPQAIGAQLSHPDRQVLRCPATVGASLGDLLSLRQLALPVKLVVFRNDALGFRTRNEGGGILDFATALHNPDLPRWPKLRGCWG
jgi:pyruvate dehydrogenase (quinone)